MQKSEVPFFARFLETQESRVPATDKAGRFDPPVHTMKYPSDDDDNPPTFPL